jgi:hypothetical protein
MSLSDRVRQILARTAAGLAKHDKIIGRRRVVAPKILKRKPVKKKTRAPKRYRRRT